MLLCLLSGAWMMQALMPQDLLLQSPSGPLWAGAGFGVDKKRKKDHKRRSANTPVCSDPELAEDPPFDAGVSRRELDAALSEMLSRATAEATNAFTQVAQSSQEHIMHQLDRRDKAIHDKIEKRAREGEQRCLDRFSDFEARMRAVEVASNIQEKASVICLRRIEEVEERIAHDAVNAPTAAQEADSAWDRQEDPTVLRIRAGKPVAKAGVLGLFKELLVRAAVPSDVPFFVTSGDEVDSHFAVQFRGPSGAGARHVSKVLGVIKGKPGTPWESLPISAVDGAPTQLHLGRDENAKNQKTRFLTRKARDVFKEQLPSKAWFGRDGTVSANWKPVLEVVPSFQGPPSLHWSARGLRYHGLERATLEPLVKAALVEEVEDPEWSL